MFGGTTAIAAKQTSDDRFGCADESPLASIRPRSAFGVFLNPEFSRLHGGVFVDPGEPARLAHRDGL
jgi:hypothetical protein